MTSSGFSHEYFKLPNDKKHEKKASMGGYKTVLNGKGIEDSLVSSCQAQIINMVYDQIGLKTFSEHIYMNFMFCRLISRDGNLDMGNFDTGIRGISI